MEFKFKEKAIYYECHGEGEPLLILNGIFMSCASWAPFIPEFAKNNKLLLLDMLDQGMSEKMDIEYTLDIQADLVLTFLDHLGLEYVNICGMSYGGEVAMKISASHPDRIKRLVLSNTTAYTSVWLKDIGHSWEYAFNSYDGRQFFKTCIPSVYSPMFFEENIDWLREREEMFIKYFNKPVYDAFGRLTRSAESHDERVALKNITAPTLVISSEYDFITPVYLQKELVEAIPDAAHVTVQNAGHALMYEKPAEFTALVLGFINTNIAARII